MNASVSPSVTVGSNALCEDKTKNGKGIVAEEMRGVNNVPNFQSQRITVPLRVEVVDRSVE